MRKHRYLLVAFLLLVSSVAWAADSFILAPDPSKQIDTKTSTSGAGTVHRQGILICDKDNNNCITVDSNSGGRFSIRDSTGNLLGVAGQPLIVQPSGSTNQPVVGVGTNNGAAASTAQVSVLPCVVGASAPTHTDGRGVNLRCRIDGSVVMSLDENGMSTHYRTSTASTNAIVAKASAGVLYSFSCTNTDTTNAYINWHNTASTPTAGAGIFRRYLCPANSLGQSPNIGVDGITFSTGIAFTMTQGEADTSTTAVGADKIKLNIEYR